MSEEQLTGWALVEVEGGRKYIGQVSERVIAGHGFVQVDVPEVRFNPGNPGSARYTITFGTGALVSIMPLPEFSARVMLHCSWKYRGPEAEVLQSVEEMPPSQARFIFGQGRDQGRPIPVIDQEPFKDFGDAVEEATSSVEQLVKASSGVIPRAGASIVPASVGKCFEPDF